MGGRGSAGSSGNSFTSDGALSTKKSKIETVYREARGWQSAYYKDKVLEATTDGKGNVTFDYARGGTFEKTAKTNRTNYVTFELSAGAVNGVPFGINWDKVNSISGQTFELKKYAKDNGLSWDRDKKRWQRK